MVSIFDSKIDSEPQQSQMDCIGILSLEVEQTSLISGSASFEIDGNNCYQELVIYNKVNASKIAIYISDHEFNLQTSLKIIGSKADLVIIGSKDAYLSNVNVFNIPNLYYVSGFFKGLELNSGKVLFDLNNGKIFVKSLYCDTLTILSSQIILSGDIYSLNKLIFNLHGSSESLLDGKALTSLHSKSLIVEDNNSVGSRVILYSDLVVQKEVKIHGTSFLTSGILESHFILLNVTQNVSIAGEITASRLLAYGKKIDLLNDTSIKTLYFSKSNETPFLKISAGGVFYCGKNVTIFSAGKSVIDAAENLYFYGALTTTDNVKIESKKQLFLFPQSNITSSAKEIKIIGKEVIFKGYAEALLGNIEYEILDRLEHAGMSAASGIKISGSKKFSSLVKVIKVNDYLAQNIDLGTDSKDVMSIYAMESIKIIASSVEFNSSYIESENGSIIVEANKSIYHFNSVIYAKGNIIETAFGKEYEEVSSLIIYKQSYLTSSLGNIELNSKYNIFLNGTIIANSISINAFCFENQPDSGIHGMLGNVSISLSNCEFNNLGIISSNQSLSIRNSNGNAANYNLIAADDIRIFVHGRKDFINYAQIYSNNNVKIGLETNSKLFLKPESIMHVGSYDFGHFIELESLIRLRIGLVDCHGCSIETIKPVPSIISSSYLSIRITYYEKTDYFVVDQKAFKIQESFKKHKNKIKKITGAASKYVPAKYVDLQLSENYHRYHGPAIIKHSGDFIVDSGFVYIDKSKISSNGRIKFSGSIIKLISDQTEKRVILFPGSINELNPISNVQHSFGIVNSHVENNGISILSMPKDTVNAIIYAKEGIEGDVLQIMLGSARSIINSAYLEDPATIQSARHNTMADITLNMITKGKAIIVFDWQRRISQVENITPEYFRENGFDISKLIDPRLINSNIWDQIPREDLLKISTSVAPEELNLQPIFFMKKNPIIASFIEDPLNIAHFLASLAFREKGLVYTIGDGHFISKLVDQSVFIFLGVLAGIDNVKLLNSLAVNAQYEQPKLNLTAGIPLNKEQIKNLSSSIIWPVWLENCVGEIRCLDYKLYFNEYALNNTLSGAVIATSGDINFKVLGDVLVGLDGQINAENVIKFDLQGNFLNLGTIRSNNDAVIAAENIGNLGNFKVTEGKLSLTAKFDIVNIGSSFLEQGDVHLSAGRDIKELVLINEAHPITDYTKRSIYAIGGNLYYEADHDIKQQAAIIFVRGNVEMKAKNDISIEAYHHIRLIKNERSGKHILIQNTIDQYDAIIRVGGSLTIDAGNNFIGSGVKFYSRTSDIYIKAENKIILEDKTSYTWNYYWAKKSNFFGSSSISVQWTTSQTARLELSTPNGKVYISSGDCTVEGGTISGKKTEFHCKKLVIKPHYVVNKMITIASKNWLFSPKIPVVDFIESSNKADHLCSHTICREIDDLFNTQGPLDLLPAINLISAIPGMVADYNFISQAGLPLPITLMGTLLSRYIAAGISFGSSTSTSNTVQTIATLTVIDCEDAEFKGNEGNIAANINCENNLNIEYQTLDIGGATNKQETTSSFSSSGFNIGASLNGVSFGINFVSSSSSYQSSSYVPGSIYAKNMHIKIGDKLTIENAQLNGENISIEAASIEIKQVFDSSSFSSENYGGGIGLTISWAGDPIPNISAEYASVAQESQVVKFISGISGENVEIIAKNLIFNIQSISAANNLNINAENKQYTEMPETSDSDKEYRAAASVSARSDGKMCYATNAYYRDGDFVASGGISNSLFEGIEILKDATSSFFSSNEELTQESAELEGILEETENSQEQADESESPEGKDKKNTPNKIAKKQKVEALSSEEVIIVKEYKEQVRLLENKGTTTEGTAADTIDNKEKFSFAEANALDGKLSVASYKVKEAFGKYQQYANKYPSLEPYFMNILEGFVYVTFGAVAGGVAGTTGGPAGIGIGAIGGATAGIGMTMSSGVRGYIIEKIAGKEIAEVLNTGIAGTAQGLRFVDSKLKEEESIYLAVGVIAIAGTLLGLKGEVKQLIKIAGTKSANLLTSLKNFKFNNVDISESKITQPVAYNADNDFLSKYSFTDDLSKIDFETTPKFELGKISSASKHQVLNKLPDYVPEGRINYIRKFSADLQNFIQGTEKLFHGKLTEDLYLINYHDKSLNIGKGERTLTWATHLEVGNRMPTTAEIHQHLALVEPDWGVRNSYSVIKIPAGEQVTFVSGKAKIQPSLITGKEFKGGGYQVRFRGFDEKWIIETKDLNK